MRGEVPGCDLEARPLEGPPRDERSPCRAAATPAMAVAEARRVSSSAVPHPAAAAATLEDGVSHCALPSGLADDGYPTMTEPRDTIGHGYRELRRGGSRDVERLETKGTGAPEGEQQAWGLRLGYREIDVERGDADIELRGPVIGALYRVSSTVSATNTACDCTVIPASDASCCADWVACGAPGGGFDSRRLHQLSLTIQVVSARAKAWAHPGRHRPTPCGVTFAPARMRREPHFRHLGEARRRPPCRSGLSSWRR
jgi:hypothetical protein